jgi:3-hydroxy-3-methylglutaryl CoA synthase
VILFSYGSGSAAAMFSMVVTGSLDKMRNCLDETAGRLERRIRCTPQEFDETMVQLDAAHQILHAHVASLFCSGGVSLANVAGEGAAPQEQQEEYRPSDSIERLFVNTYYLQRCDRRKRRFYAIKQQQVQGHAAEEAEQG